MRITAIIAAAIAIGGCTSLTRENELQLVTPSDINSDPKKFDGHRIKVEGYLTLRHDSHIIFQSKDLNAELKSKIDGGGADLRDYEKFCVTVLINKKIVVSNSMRSGVSAVVVGVYEDNYLDGTTLDMGACPTKGALRITDVREK